MHPTPQQIREARLKAGLSQRKAAELIFSKLRTWQDSEYGISKMSISSWLVFCIAIGKIDPNILVSRYKEITLKSKR